MSLTSVELNYLVWRYLQESGLELAAYALQKQTNCSEFEKSATPTVAAKVEPGCLVDLVQKGILYSVCQEEASGEAATGSEDPASRLSLFGALIKDRVAQAGEAEEMKNGDRYLLKSQVVDEKSDAMDITEPESPKETPPETVEPQLNDFHTSLLNPIITFPASLVADWHPTTQVFAYGKDDSVAVINAIQNNAVAESVTLVHPNILHENNEVNIVSWSPHGNLILTAAAKGELRAWSPDGKLKNIANGLGDKETDVPSLISDLLWSDHGQLLLSIDCDNQVSLWDGTTLSLIKQIRPPQAVNDASVIDACWLDDNKFAVSTTNHSIKIYSVSLSQQHSFQSISDVHTVGYLHGHENSISILKFNSESKLLASCSDYDYAIKVWSRGSSQECLDLNTGNIKLHTSPVVGLHWLQGHQNTSFLLSVSMEGVANIWNATSGENMRSVQLFNPQNFKADQPISSPKETMVFSTALSPNHQWLACGDDSGRVTIWDVRSTSYTSNEPKDVLKCTAIYDLNVPQKDSNIGICDLRWDSTSTSVCVCYKGTESLILHLES